MNQPPEFSMNTKDTFCCYEPCGYKLMRGQAVIFDPETLTYCTPKCYNLEMKSRRERYANDGYHPERY